MDPTHVPLPPTLAELLRTMADAPPDQPVDEALADASSALAEYNKLPAKAKAGYLLRLRREKAELYLTLAGVNDQKIAEHEKHPTAESAMQVGKSCLMAGDTHRAAKLFEEAAELSQDQASRSAACAYRGEALLKSAGGRSGLNLEYVKQAALLFEQASGLRPEHGFSLDPATMFVRRIQEIKQIMEAGEDDFNVKGLGQLLAEDLDAAKDAFELAVEVEPDNPEYLLNLSLTCSCVGQFGRGAKLAMRALKINPGGRTGNLVFATAGMRAAILRAQG